MSALNAADGAVAWSIEAGATIRATPLVAGSALYVPTDKALLKLDLATGRRLWAVVLGKARAAARDHRPQLALGPLFVVGGRRRQFVYVGSRDGCVYRFNAEFGETLGRYCATDMITATPVVDGKRVYFASFDKHVYAADRDSGRSSGSMT